METHIQDFKNGSNFSSPLGSGRCRTKKDAKANIESHMAYKRLFVNSRHGFQVA